MMDNGNVTAGYIVRLIGLMGIVVGAAWAVQTVGFGRGSVASTLMWVIAAASIAGAGSGLVLASTNDRLSATPFGA